MHNLAAAPPLPPAGTGSCQPGVTADDHSAVRVVLAVLHQNLPSTLRSRPRGGDVTTQVHQYLDPVSVCTRQAHRSAATALAVAPRSSSVPGGSRTDVPSNSTSAQLTGSRNDVNRGFARIGDVAGVAQRHQCAAHGGVDVAVGGSSSVQCGRDQNGWTGLTGVGARWRSSAR